MKRLAPDADDTRFIRRIILIILIAALTTSFEAHAAEIDLAGARMLAREEPAAAANQAAVDRALEILGEIRSGGTFDLTTLPVALREVRNLIGRG